MSNFINLSDYNASIHSEILDSLIRSDEAIVEICEDRAVDEMRSYLSSRYNCDTLFSAEGSDRNQLVLMMALDISIYHLFCLGNPQKLSQMRKDRYDRAIEWLKSVRRGNLLPAGLTPIEDNTKSKSPFQMRSNPKRINRL